MQRELGSLNQKLTSRNAAFLGSEPNSVVLIIHRRVEVKYLLISEKHTLACVTVSRRSSRLQRSSLFCFVAALITWAGTQRNAKSDRSNFAMRRTLVTDSQVFGNTACALTGSRCVCLWANQISNLFDVVRHPCWSRSSIAWFSLSGWTLLINTSACSLQTTSLTVYQEILKRFFCILNQVCTESEFSSCHLRISYPSLTVRKFKLYSQNKQDLFTKQNDVTITSFLSWYLVLTNVFKEDF